MTTFDTLMNTRTLAQRLAEDRIPVADALRYSMQLAEALRKLHEEGRVHGSVSPVSIALDNDAVDLLPGMVPAGGATPYAAPEVIDGRTPDTRSDIFSFGAVVYEMLTGKRAFEGADRAKPAPSGSPAVDRFVGGCVAADPAARLQNIKRVMMELKLLNAAARRAETATTTRPNPNDAVVAEMHQLETHVAARLQEQQKFVGEIHHAVSEAVATLRGQLAAVSTELAASLERSNQVERSIDTAGERIANHVQQSLDAAFERISSAQQAADAASERISSVQQTADAASERISSVQEGIDSASERIASLEQSSDAAAERINSLQNNLDAAHERISTAQQGVNTAFEHISSIQDGVNAVSERIASVQHGVDSGSERAAAVQLSVDAASVRIAAVEQGFMVVNSRIEHLEQKEIPVPEPTIPAEVQQTIDSSAERIASLEQALESAHNRVAELEAWQAATSQNDELHRNLAALVDRVSNVEMGVDNIAQRTGDHYDSLAQELMNFEKTLQKQSASIESTRTAMAQTDDLVERVVEALESLQTIVLEQSGDRALSTT